MLDLEGRARPAHRCRRSRRRAAMGLAAGVGIAGDADRHVGIGEAHLNVTAADLAAVERGGGFLRRAIRSDVNQAVRLRNAGLGIAGEKCADDDPEGIEGLCQLFVGIALRQFATKRFPRNFCFLMRPPGQPYAPLNICRSRGLACVGKHTRAAMSHPRMRRRCRPRQHAVYRATRCRPKTAERPRPPHRREPRSRLSPPILWQS